LRWGIKFQPELSIEANCQLNSSKSGDGLIGAAILCLIVPRLMKRPELDPIATLRELREYLALSYEANHRIAQRIGITVATFNGFLMGKRVPQAKTIAKLKAFLSA
jgi:hypothetical protein